MKQRGLKGVQLFVSDKCLGLIENLGQGSCGAYLASRGAEGTAEAEATRTSVAQRWFVCTVQAGTSQPRVELRFSQRTDAYGRSVRLLNLIDEYARESLLVRAERRWSSSRVISALADVMVLKRVPEHLRSGNGPEFVAKDLGK